MPLADAVTRGLDLGLQQARARAAGRAAAEALEAAAPFRGYLVLEGDSWFDYPLWDEITEDLRDEHNYKTRSAARHGDTAQEIAYLPKQLGDFEALFRDLADDKHVARAILLSCGGNDVMDALAALMNPKGAGGPVWHAAVVDAVIKEHVPFAIAALIGRAIEFSQRYFQQKRPILLHGYGDPVPDGRGYKFVATLSGPWMKPVFARKGYVSGDPQPPAELKQNADSMAELMKVFNEDVLPGIAALVNQQQGATIVHYVDVRAALSRDLQNEKYKDDWANELHPTGSGFEQVTTLLHAAIQAAAPTVPPDLP
jgi:hypothetical protein